MNSKILALSLLAVVTTSVNAIDIGAFGVALTENFDTLVNTSGTTTATTLPSGWALTETGGGARDNEAYAVDTGASTTGDTYSYGSAASTDRALGGLQSGTLIPVFGVQYKNTTGGTITSLLISYVGEEWRLGAAGRGSDRLDFQYSLDASDLVTGTWINFDTLDFSTPDTTTVGAKNGNAAADRTAISDTILGLTIANGSTFWLRWNDFNISGSDDGLAVDDFSLTARGVSSTVPESLPFSFAAVTLLAVLGLSLKFSVKKINA